MKKENTNIFMREHIASKSKLLEIQREFDTFTFKKEAELARDRKTIKQSLMDDVKKD